jgi:hypothetical protein
VFAISLLVVVLVFWTHRANIVRLRNGEEHRFGKRGVPAKRSAATVAIGLVIVVAILIAARMG